MMGHMAEGPSKGGNTGRRQFALCCFHPHGHACYNDQKTLITAHCAVLMLHAIV